MTGVATIASTQAIRIRFQLRDAIAVEVIWALSRRTGNRHVEEFERLAAQGRPSR